MHKLKKIISFGLLPLALSSCAPFVPDNYLSPRMIQTSERVHGKLLRPRLIPLSIKMLDTPSGQQLLKAALKPQPYRVGAFDNINIIIWGHPDLSTVSTSVGTQSTTIPSSLTPGGGAGFTAVNSNMGASTNFAILVQTDGTIFYPYVGQVKVSGLTITQIQNKIARRLSRYIRNPQVTVQVAKFRNRNTYVLGEVNAPGAQALTDKPLTLMEAISNAGGINPRTADPTHVYVVRGSYESPDVYWLNAQSPQALMIAEKFPLRENDIVYISAASLNSLNSFFNQVLPSFTVYYTIKGLS